MTKPRQFQAIKGVRDVLPPDSALWNRVEQSAREVFGTFGFHEVRLPILEERELFVRSVGADTEIVSKEMFQLEDWPAGLDDPRKRIFDAEEVRKLEKAMARGELPDSESNQRGLIELKKAIRELDDAQARYQGTSNVKGSLAEYRRLASEYSWQAHSMLGQMLVLRPEATASVVRAYIEHGMQVQPGNVKLFYMGPMFRRERPQKGRYRQFYQIGAEVLGTSDAPGIDAEVIEMLLAFFERVKLKGALLAINSIGCKECRPAYVEKLRAELEKVREQLGEDSKRRIETNPLRVLDSKLEHEQPIIEKLPRISEHLCAACRAHYDEVKRQLGLRNISFEENWRLVRGLDYYMRTTFEITAPGLGSQNAVCGGGRYDGLVEMLGGPANTKGIGFAIGTDRLILSLQEQGAGESAGGLDVYLAWFGTPAQAAAIGLAKRLREAGFVVEVPTAEMKFGKSLGLADRLKARHAVIIGEDELAADVVTVKRFSDGLQQKLGEAELFSYLRSARSE